jgi:hypothetical protein
LRKDCKCDIFDVLNLYVQDSYAPFFWYQIPFISCICKSYQRKLNPLVHFRHLVITFWRASAGRVYHSSRTWFWHLPVGKLSVINSNFVVRLNRLKIS